MSAYTCSFENKILKTLLFFDFNDPPVVALQHQFLRQSDVDQRVTVTTVGSDQTIPFSAVPPIFDFLHTFAVVVLTQAIAQKQKFQRARQTDYAQIHIFPFSLHQSIRVLLFRVAGQTIMRTDDPQGCHPILLFAVLQQFESENELCSGNKKVLVFGLGPKEVCSNGFGGSIFKFRQRCEVWALRA